mmetsp:Transcript_25591/g.86270  ORF Transcript_25591/g.86270 Transcript_25591/m.86270 type:complete len:258 (+) Transcript_25591:979-1752(+)
MSVSQQQQLAAEEAERLFSCRGVLVAAALAVCEGRRRRGDAAGWPSAGGEEAEGRLGLFQLAANNAQLLLQRLCLRLRGAAGLLSGGAPLPLRLQLAHQRDALRVHRRRVLPRPPLLRSSRVERRLQLSDAGGRSGGGGLELATRRRHHRERLGRLLRQRTAPAGQLRLGSPVFRHRLRRLDLAELGGEAGHRRGGERARVGRLDGGVKSARCRRAGARRRLVRHRKVPLARRQPAICARVASHWRRQPGASTNMIV